MACLVSSGCFEWWKRTSLLAPFGKVCGGQSENRHNDFSKCSSLGFGLRAVPLGPNHGGVTTVRRHFIRFSGQALRHVSPAVHGHLTALLEHLPDAFPASL